MKSVFEESRVAILRARKRFCRSVRSRLSEFHSAIKRESGQILKRDNPNPTRMWGMVELATLYLDDFNLRATVNLRFTLTTVFTISICWTVSCSITDTYGDVLFPPHGFWNSDPGGWEGAGPVVMPSGGPGGEGDEYLQVLATEAGRQGSRAAVYNTDPFWTENIRGSVGFKFDMVSFPESAAELEMRFVLFGPDIGTRWTSTEPIVVPNDGEWRPYSFALKEEDFTQVAGTATFDETLADVERIMLRHDADTPSAQGTPVSALIGLDNLEIDLGPCFFGFCDVNFDGTCDIGDLDSLMETIASGSYDQSIDVNQDGVINDIERDHVLHEISWQLGFAGPILLGDANLDGVVNATDLNAVALNWQSDKAKWSQGNFTGKGVNAADLNALALNWQKATPIAAESSHAVPEPSSVWLAIVAIATLAHASRK